MLGESEAPQTSVEIEPVPAPRSPSPLPGVEVMAMPEEPSSSSGAEAGFASEEFLGILLERARKNGHAGPAAAFLRSAAASGALVRGRRICSDMLSRLFDGTT